MSRARTRLALMTVALASLLAIAVVGPALAGAEVPADTAVPQRDLDAERLALSMLNCTRTGGWVRADGSCNGRRSGAHSPFVSALRFHDGVSGEVAFRWAGEMIRADVCAHVIPGQPDLGVRLAAAGFDFSTYGENVGCTQGRLSPRATVIWVHRAMQGEQSSGGGHWRNIKQPGFRGVGIGVATLDGRTTVVYDFYG